MYIPKLPNLLAKIALEVSTKPTHPWDLYQLILVWEADKSAEVKQLMVPIKNWCIFAATTGTAKDTSTMSYILPLLNRPLAGLKEA